MKEIAPLYNVPTRNTIKSRIQEKYDVVSLNFKNVLKEVDDITITMDIWSEMMTTKSFLGFTVHFIHSTKLCSAALGIFELSQSHTANYIYNELMNVLSLWDIPKSKILAIVTDNDATMLKAVGEKFGKKKHLRCFAHSINLVAEATIKKVDGLQNLISQVRNIVKFIKRSVNCSDELRQLQEKNGDSFKKLILDVVTRWNSVYYLTLLDPRFKNIHFKDAVALSKHLVFIQSSINNMENSTPDIDYSNDSSDSVSDPSQVDLWGYHKQLAQKYQKKYIDKSNQENQQNLGHEITMYLSTPVSTLNTDPLMCWEELKPMYPSIYKLATKYLSGVCTSVPSERLFSCASNTISKTRNRLSGKLASKLIFLNKLDDQFWM